MLLSFNHSLRQTYPALQKRYSNDYTARAAKKKKKNNQTKTKPEGKSSITHFLFSPEWLKTTCMKRRVSGSFSYFI